MHFVRAAVPLAAVMFVAFLSAHAAAQAASATVAVTVPAGPTTIAQGGNTSLAVKVTFSVQNVVCAPEAGTATVNLAVADATPMQGIAFSLPASVSFNMGGPMAYSQAGPYTNETTVQLNVTVASGTLANHEHTVNVTATFTGSQLVGCTQSPAPGATMDVSDSAATTIKTGAGGPGPSGTTSGVPVGNTTTTEASPSLPLGVQIPVLLGLGILALRRKQ